MNTLTSDGYEAVISFDEEANLFHGEVVNIRDVVTFQGRSVDELREAFRGSLVDYRAFCDARGEEAERPMAGDFLVQIPPTLHRTLSASAKREGVSLDRFVVRVLEGAAAD